MGLWVDILTEQSVRVLNITFVNESTVVSERCGESRKYGWGTSGCLETLHQQIGTLSFRSCFIKLQHFRCDLDECTA